LLVYFIFSLSYKLVFKQQYCIEDKFQLYYIIFQFIGTGKNIPYQRLKIGRMIGIQFFRFTRSKHFRLQLQQ